MSVRDEHGALGLRVDRVLRARSAGAALHTAAARWAPWSCALPLLALALHLAQRAAGVQLLALGWPALLALALVPLALLLAAAWMRARSRPLSTARGLARLDAELGSRERLQTAWELSALAERTPFVAAAIEDAAPWLARARAHELQRAPRRPLRAGTWLAPLAALFVAWLAAHWAPEPAATVELAQAPELGRPPDAPAEVRSSGAPRATPPELREEPREARAPDAPPGSARSERQPSAAPERAPRESRGKSGEGRSAEAVASSQPSDSAGVPSSPTKPSEPSESSKLTPKPPKPRTPRPETAQPARKPPEESGATAGRGTGSGSSRNPGATDWASKDQVSNDEEPPQSEDADVDDETEESEARGGLQPNLRDRRPPVNRDLTIGFGNQPNPDANGRGGPSEQKKSRGVASLVLGVPIPDHVKGRPRPGRTKITQERIDPRAEAVGALTAEARTPRSAPIAPIARPALEPWMRELVKKVFLPLPERKPTP